VTRRPQHEEPSFGPVSGSPTAPADKIGTNEQPRSSQAGKTDTAKTNENQETPGRVPRRRRRHVCNGPPEAVLCRR
jgi:hypothetical protein